MADLIETLRTAPSGSWVQFHGSVDPNVPAVFGTEVEPTRHSRMRRLICFVTGHRFVGHRCTRCGIQEHWS